MGGWGGGGSTDLQLTTFSRSKSFYILRVHYRDDHFVEAHIPLQEIVGEGALSEETHPVSPSFHSNKRQCTENIAYST